MPRSLVGNRLLSLVRALVVLIGLALPGFASVGCSGCGGNDLIATGLNAITIDPPSAKVTVGASVAFKATEHLADSTDPIPSSDARFLAVTWSSSDPTIATVDGSGNAKGIRVGTVKILVTVPSSGVSATAQLTVSQATLDRLEIAPAAASIAKGRTQAFTATAIFSDDTKLDVTSTVAWTTKTPAVATIAATGDATAVSAGTTDVVATDAPSGISATAKLTVTDALLTSIDVTPVTKTIPKGTVQAFTATGKFSDGTTKDLTETVDWAAAAASVASITRAGSAKGLAAGTTTITATDRLTKLSGSATLVVTDAVLVSIAVTPATRSIPNGTTEAFTATGTFSDGTTQDLTGSATWSSSATNVASVASTGVASALSVGTATVKATDPATGIFGTATLTVTGAVLDSIAIAPANPTIPKGTTQAFVATATYSDTTTRPITTAVTWTSSDASATISNAAGAEGVATGANAGTSTITATDPTSGKSATTVLTVTGATLVSINVTPANRTLAAGLTQQYVATGVFSDGSNANLSALVTWDSSDKSTATVSNAGARGLATTSAPGSTTISAAAPGTAITGQTTLTVSGATLVSLQIAPTKSTLALGNARQFTATGIYTNGSNANLTTQVTWGSSVGGVATISNANGSQGLASSVANGTTTVSASMPGTAVSASTTLTVTSAVLVALQIAPANPTVAKGLTQPFTATGIYSDSSSSNLTTQVTWASSTANASISNALGSAGVANAVSPGTSTISASMPGTLFSASTTMTITSAVLTAIQVSPGNATLADGLTLPYTAQGVYSDNTNTDLTTQVTWASSTANASISNAVGSKGLATAQSVGTTTISATLGAISGSTGLTVTAATIALIQVTPANTTLPNGQTLQYTATGIYTDATQSPLTTQVTWASSTANATISNAVGSKGLATAQSVGATTISASLNGITGSTTLTVTAAVLTSIAIAPTNPSVAKGLTQPFAATGIYSDNSSADVTTQVTWGSSTTNVDISNALGSAGLANAVSVGTSTISASMPGTLISGSTTMTVTSAVLTTIQVSPVNATLANGLTLPYTAQGVYSDNSNSDITTQVTWASSTTNASISNAVGSKGLATAQAVGTTTISATLGAISGSTGLTVTAATIALIQVTPTNTTLPNGQTLQFTATGIYTDATQSDLTTQVTWASSTANATISNAVGSKGLVTAQSVGATTISASLNGTTGSTTLTITAAVLTAIQVDPAEASSAKGTTRPYTATGQYSDGSTADLTTSVTWTPSNPLICTVDTTGLATANGLGDCTITAAVASPAISGTALLHVTVATLTSIDVTPPNPSVAKGSTQQFAATGHYSDNTVQDLTTQATWSSSATGIASVGNASGVEGLAAALNVGTATITATVGLVSGSTVITVTGATLSRIEVSPTNPTTPTRAQEDFSATAVYSDNTTVDVTTTVTWSSSNTAIATISNDHVAGTEGSAFTTSTPGTTTITATDATSGMSGSTVMTTVVATIVSITVTPANATLPKGAKLKYKAVATYDIGITRDVTQYVSWSANSPSIAGIGNSPRKRGIATAKKAGTATITATDGVSGVSGSTSLTVSGATLTAIAVTPANTTIARGTKQQFKAIGSYFNGTTTDLIDITSIVTWSSSNTAAATISNNPNSTGFASTSGAGVTTISAIEPVTAISGSTTLTVSSATLVSIAITPASPSIFQGEKLLLTATATFSDLSTKDVTLEVTWSTGNGAIATVANQTAIKGLLTGVAAGSTTVTAIYPQTAISTTAPVTIKP